LESIEITKVGQIRVTCVPAVARDEVFDVKGESGMEERYRILRLASLTLKILAWVVLVVSIIVAIVGLVLIPTTGISRGLSIAGVALL
jgi:hypothetical protein